MEFSDSNVKHFYNFLYIKPLFIVSETDSFNHRYFREGLEAWIIIANYNLHSVICSVVQSGGVAYHQPTVCVSYPST